MVNLWPHKLVDNSAMEPKIVSVEALWLMCMS